MIELNNCIATISTARFDREGWEERFNLVNQRVKEGNVDILFLGDSIMRAWEDAPDIWNKYYGMRNAVNMGFGGDQTQHLLWRLENGHLEGISPRLAILLIGTNNCGLDMSPEDTVEGIAAVVETLRKSLPQTITLLLGIFPRGQFADDPIRANNNEVNAVIKKMDDGEKIHYLDIGEVFTEEDGSISEEIMPDFLHLSIKGYGRWAQAMEYIVSELMSDSTGR